MIDTHFVLDTRGLRYHAVNGHGCGCAACGEPLQWQTQPFLLTISHEPGIFVTWPLHQSCARRRMLVPRVCGREVCS